MAFIISGVICIIGGLSGALVLMGTNSSGALVIIGIVLICWGFMKPEKKHDSSIDNATTDEKLFALAVLLYNKKEYPEAIKSISDAVSLNPTNAVYYATRAGAYSAIRQWDESLADLSRAIELEPNSPGLYYDRGHTYKGKGDYEAAMKDYAEAARMGHEKALRIINEAGE